MKIKRISFGIDRRKAVLCIAFDPEEGDVIFVNSDVVTEEEEPQIIAPLMEEYHTYVSNNQ